MFFLATIDPTVWASIGVGCAMGLSGVGAAWYFSPFPYLLLAWCIG